MLEVPAQEQHEHHFCSSFTNTVYYIFSMYTVRRYRTSPGAPDLRAGVGLTPRQYTEWNVAGRARSTGDLSQQGLLPEVYRTASTGWCAHLRDQQTINNKRTDHQDQDPEPCALAIYIADDALHHQPMGAGHMNVPVMQALLDSYPALVLYLAGDALRQQPMESRSHDCSSYVGCGKFRVLQWCHPMPACIEDNKLWHPDDHLIWCPKVDSGPRNT